jgi:hypothetical protein
MNLGDQRPPARGTNETHRSVDRSLLADLSKPVRAPDMTRPIMGRLGYMHVNGTVARRKRLQQWASRVGVLLAAALALGIGLRFYEHSSAMRRPAGLTIPDALGNDLQLQQHRIGNVIRTIRSLSPKPPQDRPSRSAPEAGPPSLNDDVNDWSIAPVRWV